MGPNVLTGSTLKNLQATLTEATRRQLKSYPRIYEAIRSGYQWARARRNELAEAYSVRFVILLYPILIKDRFYKGVLWVMGNTSHIVRRYPDIKNYFILISTDTGGRSWAAGRDEDIHGLTLEAYRSGYREKFPGRCCMVIRNADFLDEQEFYPLEVQKRIRYFLQFGLMEG